MVIIDNKHFLVEINEHLDVVGNKQNKLRMDWSYQKRSTYATKFQMKKAIKRKIIRILRKAIEDGTTVRNNESISDST